MSNPIFPQPFQSGFRTIDGTALNSVIDADVTSSQDGITATAGGGQTNAFQLVTNISRVTVVASTNDSVKLPSAIPGSSVYVDNDSANILAVYPFGTDTIEDSTSAVSLAVGQDANFVCPAVGKWYQEGTSGSFTGAFDGVVGGTTPAAGTFTNLKANTKFTYTGVRVGTFVANGASAVTVANANVTANSMIFVSLNTVGGTVGAIPAVKTITAATGFTVAGTASDTSTYNYAIIEAV